MDSAPGIRPRPTLRRRLDAAARAGFPGASTALVLLLLAAPIGLPAQAELQPALVLGCVYFWSLFRPASMPPALVFVLGLMADLLGEAPIGVMVLILLIVHGIALRARRVFAQQGFLVVWLAFIVVAIGAAGLDWALSSILAFRLLPLGPAIFQAAIAAGVYPALAVLLIAAHRGIAAPERA